VIKIVKKIENFILGGIIIVLSGILLMSFVDIVYIVATELLAEPFLIINSDGLMNLFSLLLLLLIGLELIETVKIYLKEDIVHVEFIILVAIIAIARKVIIWDFEKYSTEQLIGLSIMIFSLGLTYFLLKKADINISFKKKKIIKLKLLQQIPLNLALKFKNP
jgi:uncharacterized membrane protein (DUF373 family)